MKFLQLNTLMQNVTFTSNTIEWEIPNLQLDSNGFVALSSMTCDRLTSTSEKKAIIVKSNLIERDLFNSDGVLICFPSESTSLTYFSNSLEFWKLDCSRPRTLIFQFDGIDVSSLTFVNIVLVLQ